MNSQYKPSTQQQAVIDFARTGRGAITRAKVDLIDIVVPIERKERNA
jgi:hypothetical protein